MVVDKVKEGGEGRRCGGRRKGKKEDETPKNENDLRYRLWVAIDL